MIAWIIVLSILGIIAVVLLSSLKIVLSIDDKIIFKVSFLFITFVNYDSSKKKKKIKKVVKKKHKKKNKKSLVDTLKNYAASKSKKELIGEIFGYLKIVLSRFKALLKHTRFKKAVLDLTVATDDAANTALLYGKLCSLVYPVISLLDAAMKFDPKSISVKTDFASSEIKFSMSGILKVKLIYILGFIISIAFTIIKSKIGDINNGKQS